MATVLDIVTRAYRKIGVVAADEALTADQADAGLDAINEMMAAWTLDSVDVLTAKLTLADTFPLGIGYEEGVIYNLARRLEPEFDIPPRFDSDDWFRKIQIAYLTMPTSTIASALLRTPSQRRQTEEF